MELLPGEKCPTSEISVQLYRGGVINVKWEPVDEKDPSTYFQGETDFKGGEYLCLRHLSSSCLLIRLFCGQSEYWTEEAKQTVHDTPFGLFRAASSTLLFQPRQWKVCAVPLSEEGTCIQSPPDYGVVPRSASACETCPRGRFGSLLDRCDQCATQGVALVAQTACLVYLRSGVVASST